MHCDGTVLQKDASEVDRFRLLGEGISGTSVGGAEKLVEEVKDALS